MTALKMSQILRCVTNLHYSHLTRMHGIGLGNIFWFPKFSERKEINLQLMLLPINNSSFYIPVSVCCSSPRGHKHKPVCCMWWFISAEFLYIYLWFSFSSAIIFRTSELEHRYLAIGHYYPIKTVLSSKDFPSCPMIFGNKASEDKGNILHSLFQ